MMLVAMDVASIASAHLTVVSTYGFGPKYWPMDPYPDAMKSSQQQQVDFQRK